LVGVEQDGPQPSARTKSGFSDHDSHLFDGVDERQVGKAAAWSATVVRRLAVRGMPSDNAAA
jgi:hypothetical protein